MLPEGKPQTPTTWSMDGFPVGNSLNRPKPNNNGSKQAETSVPPRQGGDYSQKQVRGGV